MFPEPQVVEEIAGVVQFFHQEFAQDHSCSDSLSLQFHIPGAFLEVFHR